MKNESETLSAEKGGIMHCLLKKGRKSNTKCVNTFK